MYRGVQTLDSSAVDIQEATQRIMEEAGISFASVVPAIERMVEGFVQESSKINEEIDRAVEEMGLRRRMAMSPELAKTMAKHNTAVQAGEYYKTVDIEMKDVGKEDFVMETVFKFPKNTKKDFDKEDQEDAIEQMRPWLPKGGELEDFRYIETSLVKEGGEPLKKPEEDEHEGMIQRYDGSWGWL
jgi:hypothetical protein